MISNEKKIYINTIKDLKDIKIIIKNDPVKVYVQYLLKYSIILSTSSLEKLFKIIMFRFLTINSNSLSSAYFEKTFLMKSYNPSYENMIKFIRNIDNTNFYNDIKETIKTLKYEKHIEFLDTLVKIRHQVAHENANISISINEVITCFRSGIKILLLIECIINKHFSTGKAKALQQKLVK